MHDTTTQPAAVETGIIIQRDVMLVEPRDVEHPDELWHLVTDASYPRAGMAYCGERIGSDGIETALVDQAKGDPRAADDVASGLVLMCALCARIDAIMRDRA